MKKRIFGILVFSLFFIVFTGCNPKTDEDFSGEYFKNFPDVKNIVYYLELEKDCETVLHQDEEQLIFCFSVDENVDVHDESIVSYANYIRGLESEGYQLTLRDATISQTFELENNDNTISITIISDIDKFKEVHTDISNIDKITNENILYELTKK